MTYTEGGVAADARNAIESFLTSGPGTATFAER
jgi:hypothetical protein